MNFLAHIYLSHDDDEIKIGNFIADSIRGKKYMEYPPQIQRGILLHRNIDTFTDAHPTVRLSTKRLHANYSHYSGVIVDILYDHFLAKNWKNYSDIPLETYVDDFYHLLEDNYETLPLNVQRLLPHMIQDNWLLSYASIEGITKVLEGMNKRTQNRSRMNLAVVELQEFYDEFEAEFTSFFKELTEFSKQKLNELQKKTF
ncbi:Acyl carrier protein phosphodiesterase [Kordia antarctica]|uniref:Acyl carrier protein phosphodiesterase n=1 Tax=Kordia antarctica TaxID=1218801 RepID=A0A7L4ZFG9_9FLAO|nr:acyl carrier protein phosphodiesterase [Kordia antarctica]QHI34946.1 Acyl carrier protein phosphodiesterase [Kordia antarctica]